jgi:hypothetical protein
VEKSPLFRGEEPGENASMFLRKNRKRFGGRSSAGLSRSQRDIAYQPRATLWGTCPAPGRVLKERRLSSNGRRVLGHPGCGVPSERMKVATPNPGRCLGLVCVRPFRAIPLNSGSPLQSEFKCPNSGSPIQGETGAARGVHSHHPFDGRRGSRKAGRTGERYTTPHRGHA